MHLPRLTLAVAVAASLSASAAAAAGHFKSNVCGLLSAKQVTAVHGLTAKCANAKPAQGPGSTIYVGNWAGKTPRSPQLQITVSHYTDAGLLQLATRNLKQGLPGAPRKVAGIGSGAFDAHGASAEAIHFAVGKNIVAITLATGAPAPSTATVDTLAKEVAARL